MYVCTYVHACVCVMWQHRKSDGHENCFSNSLVVTLEDVAVVFAVHFC